MNKNAEKWEKTGLLEGSSADIKDQLANGLEELAQLLILKYGDSTGEIEERGGFVSGMILPILVRIYNENINEDNRPVNITNLFLDFEKYVDENGIVSPTNYRQGACGVDDEAEYCETYLTHLKERK